MPAVFQASSPNKNIRKVSYWSAALLNCSWFGCALGLCFSPLNVAGQNASGASKHRPPIYAPSPQQQIVPYWTAEPGWHTEVLLRNNQASESLTVTPSLRLTDGSEVKLSAVTIASGTVETINLSDALAQAHPEVLALGEPYGSVVLRYTSMSNSNLFPSAMIHDEGHPIIFHIDGSQAGIGSGKGSHQGIWWLPKGTTNGYLVLTNMSQVEQHGNLLIYDPSGKFTAQTVDLPAQQTRRFSLRDLISRSGLQGSFGGLSFKMKHDINAVSSAVLLFDEPSGFSATMKTFVQDPSVTLKSHDFAGAGKWITRAPMLALENPDPALQLPSGVVLHPVIFLHNTKDTTAEAELSLHWRNSTKDGRAFFPKFVLAPMETRIVDVQALQDAGTIPADATWSQVSLTTNTLPDEVIAVAASYDKTLRYGAQTPFSDQLAFHLEGAAWEVDEYHNSLITVGNGGAKPVTARLTFFYEGGTKKYEMERTIAPDDQTMVNVGELIRNQVPDKNGNAMPRDLKTGAYQLINVADTPLPSLYEGKVVTDKKFGHATYGCMICCGYNGLQLNPDPVLTVLYGSAPLDAEGIDACGGHTYVNLDGYADPTSWYSDNTSVMTMAPSQATGVGVGNANLSVNLTNIMEGKLYSGEGNPCPVNDETLPAEGDVGPKITSIDPTQVKPGDRGDQITINGSGFGSSPTVNLPTGITQTGIAAADSRIVVTVNVAISGPMGAANLSVTADAIPSNSVTIAINGPNKMVVQSDVIGPTTDNPSAQSRFVAYQVRNFDNTAASSIPIAENISFTGYNCQQPNPGNTITSCNGVDHTDANGVFSDEWGMYTGFTPSTCGENVVDHWQWCAPVGSQPPAPNPGITFGTLTGSQNPSSVTINGNTNPPNHLSTGLIIYP